MALSPNQVAILRRNASNEAARQVEENIDAELLRGGRRFYKLRGLPPDAWQDVLAKFRAAGWRISEKYDPSGREEGWWEFS